MQRAAGSLFVGIKTLKREAIYLNLVLIHRMRGVLPPRHPYAFVYAPLRI
jgi:hypothetical protein